MKNNKSTKIKKIISVLFLVLFIFTIFTSFAFAAEVGDPDRPSWPDGEDLTNTGITVRANRIWNTFAYIAQIISIGAIIFAGVRYMFSSADNRADIKVQTAILVLGGAIVFAAVPLINFIVSVVNQALTTSPP